VRSLAVEGPCSADGAHRHSLNAHHFNVGSPMKPRAARRYGLLKIELLRRTVGVNASAGDTKMRRCP